MRPDKTGQAENRTEQNWIDNRQFELDRVDQISGQASKQG